MIVLDYSDPRPIYEQIVDKMQTYILKGILKPDEQLMSVRSLAMDLAINPNTVQKAYTELERQGFIYVVKGRGAYVRGGDDSLLAVRRRELAERIAAIVQEAENLHIDKETLYREVEDIRLEQKIEQNALGEALKHD